MLHTLSSQSTVQILHHVFFFVLLREKGHVAGENYIKRFISSYELLSKWYLMLLVKGRPPLWSSGQISWLEIQRSGFDSWHYKIF
jgi:hypothetical protein